MRVQAILLYLATIFIFHSTGERCSLLNITEDVDWTQMKRNWYDTMVVPDSPSTVHCFDWRNITAVHDGFTTIIRQRAAGHPYDEFKIHFVRTSYGVYKWNDKWTYSYRRSMRRVVSALGMKGKERDEYVKLHSDSAVLFEYQFITDTKNYFIPLVCGPDGAWRAWITHSRPVPDIYDVEMVWNALYKHGVSGPLTVNRECLSTRKSNADAAGTY